MSAPARVQADGAVLTITLDSPQRRHALTPKMRCRLVDAFIACRDNPNWRPRAQGRLEPPPDGGASGTGSLGPAGFALDKPVIAANNGACLAGGFGLMLGTDLRVVADHATFGLPEPSPHGRTACGRWC